MRELLLHQRESVHLSLLSALKADVDLNSEMQECGHNSMDAFFTLPTPP